MRKEAIAKIISKFCRSAVVMGNWIITLGERELKNLTPEEREEAENMIKDLKRMVGEITRELDGMEGR